MANEIELINPKTIGTELQKYKSQMEAALPRHMTADRMARIALTSLRVNPTLMNCTRESFYGSLMAASQLGLEPGINGQCYLIPYKNKQGLYICTLIPGWRGYMELLNRTGRAAARTEAVYDGDEFEYTMGTELTIHHKQGKWAGDQAALTHAYSVGKIKDIDFPVIDVWPIEKIWWHRDKQNKSYNKTDHYSYKHPEMYARKIPLLQVIKYLPSSVELANATVLDLTGTEGSQALTIDMALKGEFENGASIDVPAASDPVESELDILFEKTNKTPSQQKMLRESYAGRTGELVDYLNGRLAPAQVTSTPVADKVAERSENIPATNQDNSATEVKRGRGRPSKEEMSRRKAAEESATGQQSLVPAAADTDAADDDENEEPMGQEPSEDLGGSPFDEI